MLFRLAYPVLMLKSIMELTPNDCKLQAVYDIACVLFRHLQVSIVYYSVNYQCAFEIVIK